MKKSYIITSVIIIFFMLITLPLKSGEDKMMKISNSLIKQALQEEWGYNFLKELSSRGPRLSGSENSLKSLFWAKKRIEKMGFSKVWLQPTKVTHWERGEKEELKITDDKSNRKLHIIALGPSVGTDGKWLTGKILEVKSLDKLKELKDKIKGKFVFFNRPMDKTMVDTFKAYSKAVDQRVFGASKASEYGAVGVIVRSVTTRYDNNPHTGVVLYKKGIKKIPAVAIGLKDADYLSEKLSKNPDMKVSLKLYCKQFPPIKSYNLITEIKGSEKPDEIIVLGGHFDSWDPGDGSVDDGSGCIQSLEVLHLFKKLGIKPKRTVRVIFFMNEEFGSKNSGSVTYGKYAAEHSEEKHIAAIESDRGAETPRGFTISTKDEKTEEKVKSWLPYLKLALIDWIRPGGSGADVSKIKNTKAQFGYVPDIQRYFDYHHSANDRFSAIHPREFELGSAAMAILTYLISEKGL